MSPGPVRDALRAFVEALAYSPVWLLPALLLALPAVSPTEGLGRYLHRVPEQPFVLVAVAGFQPLLGMFLRPLFDGLWDLVWPRHSWGEALGRELLDRVRRQVPAGDVLVRLRTRCEEGTIDGDHLEGVMWLWVAARYARDGYLEHWAADRAARLLQNQRLHPEARAWCLRTEVRLRELAPGLLPPVCVAVVRPRP